VKLYCINPNDFYKKFPPNPSYHARVGKCINELITAYNLSDVSVLSVGAGTAHEEFHFLQHGMQVSIVDIDETKSIAPALETMETFPSSPLRYFIGDATINQPVELNKVKLLYFSSFTPDELRRNTIARDASLGFDRWFKAPPLHPTILQYADWYLEEGGILIMQSYCGSINPSSYKHKNYLPALENQLKKHGLMLSELYRFNRTKGVMLYVITKDAKPLVANKPITYFHGRSELAERAEQIWPRKKSWIARVCRHLQFHERAY
jgi:hypothetical protein